MKKYLLIAIGIIAMVLIFYNYNSSTSNLKEQVIVVGTSADNPPYEFFQDNDIVGLDIDIIKLVAKELGVGIKIQNFDFPGLLASLAMNKIDLVIAGLSKSPERAQHVEFSDVYLTAKVAALFRKEADFTNCSDLKGKVIGAQMGSTWQEIAKSINQGYENKLHFIDNNLVLVEELKAKNIDVVIVEDAQANKFIEINPELNKLPIDEYSSEFAVALPKNTKLLDKINAAIKKLQADGTIEQLKEGWLSNKMAGKNSEH